MIVRLATSADLSAVDRLLARAYPRLLAADYPASVLVTAIPLIARARPELLASRRYFVAVGTAGAILGAGGWSMADPLRRTGGAAGRPGVAHVRHVVTDDRVTRRGVGRAIMARVFEAAALAGAVGLDCLSTRTAVPFYAALGFTEIGPVEVPLAPGIGFPAVRMVRPL